ncbi:uncharacterized protein LOC110908238 [Helianthus annuus]|uniref:uncharacterized protein LOC110908238 n=1 Tax=Helianthus annuus TaxID=4232 RepID=UPI000B8F7659|nr:uncharacterized protein LOC110908238 [Helianthus annuus]KAJ0484417.1 hypothetical protein HanHA89_Chr14g0543861 [Helianthus annuus]KAJ0654969.1 hypothetical protein HanLR1_Chr14g0513121 [Helianthus annuus]
MAGDSIDLDISDDESYPTVPIWDLSDEEDVESEDDLFWEREFADELEGLPVDKEVGTFDPEGDLAYLEALLVGSPMTDIKQEEVVVEEEEHHSWPVVLITNASKSSKPREKAMRRTPGIMFQRLLPGQGRMCSHRSLYGCALTIDRSSNCKVNTGRWSMNSEHRLERIQNDKEEFGS